MGKLELGKKGYWSKLVKYKSRMFSCEDHLCVAGKNLHIGNYSRATGTHKLFACQAAPPCTTRLVSNVFPSRNADDWWRWGLQDDNFGLKGPNTHFVRKC